MTVPIRSFAICALAVLAAGCSGRLTEAPHARSGEALAFASDPSSAPPASRLPVPQLPRFDSAPQGLLYPGGSPPAPRPAVRPLQQFAAMPRFKAPAPHVRQNEAACLASGVVQPTRFVRPSGSVGSGACSVVQPFEMSAAGNGAIELTPPATLRCQMVPTVEKWVQRIARPAARHYLGEDIVAIKVAASYACRSRNSQPGARLSEHGRANALDVSSFRLASGRWVDVKGGWRGHEAERRFLRYVHRGACEHFSTVLGPNADRFHHDHFHFDLARHGRHGDYRVCR